MTRPPTKTELDALARVCASLTRRLNTAGDGIRQLLRDGLDHGYPHRASTVPIKPHNETDEDGTPIPASTQPEAAAINPDRAAVEAAAITAQLRRITTTLIALDRALEAWDPSRTVRHCPRCGHPLAPDEIRCQQLIDGRQCGTRENAERFCKGYPTADDCPLKGAPVPRGEPRRNDLCDACRKRKTRANSISTMTSIHGQGDITTGGDQ